MNSSENNDNSSRPLVLGFTLISGTHYVAVLGTNTSGKVFEFDDVLALGVDPSGTQITFSEPFPFRDARSNSLLSIYRDQMIGPPYVVAEDIESAYLSAREASMRSRLPSGDLFATDIPGTVIAKDSLEFGHLGAVRTHSSSTKSDDRSPDGEDDSDTSMFVKR